MLAQTPAGALIDRRRQKQALLLIGIWLIALAVLATAFFTNKTVLFMVVAAASGRLASKLGRKPLFIFTFV